MKKIIIATLAGGAIVALSACALPVDTTYHGRVGTTSGAALTPAVSTPSVPAVPAYPVTITGSDEEVKTANLVATGYTVNYQASSWGLIVVPVEADGSEGVSVINALGRNSSSGVTGTTTYRATGRTTFHVSNTHGPWSLVFTPLS